MTALSKTMSMSKQPIYPKARRALLIFIEGLAVLALIIGIAGGALAWRLSRGPMDIGFAREYVEEALKRPDRGYVNFDAVVLHWPDLRGSLYLGVSGANVFNEKDVKILSIDEAAISLSRPHLLIGQIAPQALILKKLALRVIRKGDGSFHLDYDAPKDKPPQQAGGSNVFEKILTYVAKPGAARGGESDLGTLQRLSIEQARVVIVDDVRDMSWSLPSVDASFYSAEEGLRADVSAALPHESEAAAFDNADLSIKALYDWDAGDIDIKGDIKHMDIAALAAKVNAPAIWQKQNIVIDANIEASLDSDLKLTAAQGVISSDKGAFSHDFIAADTIPYSNFELKAAYDSAQQSLDIGGIAVKLADVSVSGHGKFAGSFETGFRGPVHVGIEELAQSAIVPVWPQGLKDEPITEWVLEKLQDGTFRNVYADGEVALIPATGEEGKRQWSFSAEKAMAGFDFEGMTIHYKWGMSPVTEARGQGRFDIDKEYLKVAVESGKLKDMNIPEADLQFHDLLKTGAGMADLAIKLQGPLPTLLDYVTEDPVSVQHGIDASKAKGSVDLLLELDFPTLADVKKSQFEIGVSGAMNNVDLPDVLKGLNLSGESFDVAVKDGLFSLQGEGKIGGRSAKISYEEFLSREGKPYHYKVKADITADQNLRAHLGIDLDDFLQGSVPVSASYTKENAQKAVADIALNLKPARLFFEPFGYDKPPGVDGRANLKAHLLDGDIQEITGLDLAATNLSASGGHLKFSAYNGEVLPSYGRFDNLQVQATKANLEFERGQSGQYKIVLKGRQADLRPLLESENKNKDGAYDEPAILLSVDVATLRTKGGEAISAAKLYVDIDSKGRYNQLEMDGVAGGGDIYLRYKPDQQGKRTFRLEADDAGAALKAFGVYDKIKGGKMVIYGEPIRGVYDRNLVGVAELTNFKVVGAPALAKLLGAMSLPGVLNLLNNDGIAFTKLEAGFDWLYRPKGSLLVLKDGRTSGNSLGLTFDGSFDNAAETISVSGTLVPLSGINEAISSIPVIGQILSGGSGSIFAATYKMEGDSEDPKVSVNPLSVLAPGILRRILFE